MSAMVTTAALELAAPANGATISPTSAFFFSTVPSNGAMMRVLSTATCGFFYAESGRIDGRHHAFVARFRNIVFGLRHETLA